MSVDITVRKAVAYHVALAPGDWAEIQIRLLPNGGVFSCISTYGDYAHVWTSIGSGTFYQFLCSLDKNYFLKKTRNSDYRMFSMEKSCRAVRQDIIELRRELSITKEEARDCWERMKEIERDAFNSEGFYAMLDSLDVLDVVYGGSAAEIPTQEEYRPECTSFWERVWPAITEYWRKEGL